MPKYKCPVTVCNVSFEGSIWDIIPQAISHGDGSHKMNLSDEDIPKIIEKQARLESTEEFLPKEEGIGQYFPEPLDIKGYRMTQQYNWWKK